MSPTRYEGPPCATCGETLRLVSTKACVSCRRAAHYRWRQSHPDAWRAVASRHYEKHRDKIIAKAGEYQRVHKAATNERNRRRSLAEKRQTPAWADRDAMRVIYAECSRLSTETGIPHHVDHEVPLRGRNVCGLHVHYNLRAIPAAENLRKSNRC